MHPTLSQQGGTAFVTFTATGNWTASIANTRADSWISINPISGGKGEAQIAITTQANETFDERNATIHLKCGTDVKNIIVSQKQKDALTITSSKFEIDSNGGNINIEVKANITFEVDIKSDWIKQVKTTKTRALTTSNLNFAIDPNKTGDKREGEIIIKSGEFSETIKVYQGFEKFITLTQKDFSLPKEGGDINIEIKSTLEYEAKMLSNVDWITEIKSRAISTHTHHYKVMPNESYDSREVKIVFYSLEDENIADTVSVYQMYKEDILVSQDEYNIDVEGGILEINVNSNIEFDTTTSDNWIQQVTTRVLSAKTLRFTITENKNESTRTGSITLKRNNITRTITIKQLGKKNTDGNIEDMLTQPW